MVLADWSKGMEVEEYYDGYSWGLNREEYFCVDFPGAPVVKNLPANAGNMGFNPWSREIPHAVGQLSPSNTTIEPTTQLPAP